MLSKEIELELIAWAEAPHFSECLVLHSVGSFQLIAVEEALMSWVHATVVSGGAAA